MTKIYWHTWNKKKIYIYNRSDFNVRIYQNLK